jgi:hypothetical protein
MECQPGITQLEAPWAIELPGGGTVAGMGRGRWPLVAGGDVPANRRIVQLSETGAGEVVEDNRHAIVTEIVERGGESTPPMTMPPPPHRGTSMPIGGPEPALPPITATPNHESPSNDGGGGGGCSVAAGRGASSVGLLALLTALGLSLLRRLRD